MKKMMTIMLPVVMNLFGEGAGEGAPAAAAAGEADPGAPGRAVTPGRTGGRGAGQRATASRASARSAAAPAQAPAEIVAAAGTGAGEGAQQPGTDAQESAEALRAEFLSLVGGKYKSVYAAETQRLIERQTRGTKAIEQQLAAQKPIIDLLTERHGVTDGDMSKLLRAVEENDPTLAARAEANGLSIEQQREKDATNRELERLRRLEQEHVRQEQARYTANRWMAEAEQMRNGRYPDFDLRAELENPEFLSLLRANIPMEHAYEVLHRDEINDRIRLQAAETAERRMAADIRAQGMRPRENGVAPQSSFLTRMNPRGLSREEHNRINERVRHGEKITFR